MQTLKKGVSIFMLTAVLFTAQFVPGAEGANHTVKPGDTVFLIAQSHGIPTNSLIEMNSLTNPHRIYPGDVISLPVPYRVSSGDTLWRLAQKRGTTVNALAGLNSLNNINSIYPGQELLLPPASPSKSSGSVSAAPTASRSNRNFSSSELDLFARLVHSEAAGEPYEGQVAVAASVLNRIESSRYPNTLTGVIYQVSYGFYQYSPVLDGRINLQANATAHRAVRDAINGWDPSLGATGFFNPRKTSNQWVRQQPVTTVIGNHVFFR